MHTPPRPTCHSARNFRSCGTTVHNYYGPYAYCSFGKGIACVQHIQLPTHRQRRPHVLKLAIQDLWDAPD